jgi:hypothetical protein
MIESPTTVTASELGAGGEAGGDGMVAATGVVGDGPHHS